MAFLLERIAGPDTLDMTSSSSQSTLIQRNDTLKRGNMNGIKTHTCLDCRTIWRINYVCYSLFLGYHGEFTKVVYFTERTVTPFLTVIPRRLGEISLRDFKTLFDRPGVYRFHFKAQDAEYGFVKEEVRYFGGKTICSHSLECDYLTLLWLQIADDNMILPGFDGKIIAWVEEIQV